MAGKVARGSRYVRRLQREAPVEAERKGIATGNV